MRRQISFAQYRAIDLAMLTFLMLFAEVGINIARSTAYAGQLMKASPVGAIVALVMMRWGPWAAIPAVLGGLVYAAFNATVSQTYIIYGAGNLLVLVVLLYFKVFPKEQVRGSVLNSIVYAVAVQLSMLLGRALVGLVLGFPVAVCVSFITADALSVLLTVVAVWIVRRIEGLFEDQKSYLLRIQQERQVEGREQF